MQYSPKVLIQRLAHSLESRKGHGSWERTTEVGERKQGDAGKDGGYMHSEGTGEYSQRLHPHLEKAYKMLSMMEKMPIRGRPGEVGKKSRRSRTRREPKLRRCLRTEVCWNYYMLCYNMWY